MANNEMDTSIVNCIPSRPEDQSLCYLLVCFKSVEFVSFLISTIYREKDIYFIHCDKKGSDKLKSYLQNLSRIYSNIFILESIDYSWAGYSHVELVLRSMERALSFNKKWSHFITLSEQHLPLKSPDDIARTLSPGRSMMILSRATAIGASGLSDIRHRFSSTYRELPGVGCFTVGLRDHDDTFFDTIYHGSNWNVIARPHCEFLMFAENKGEFDLYKTIVHAEEIAIQTILSNIIDEIDQLESTIIAEPYRVDNHSLVMTDTLFMSSLNTRSFFIRKRQVILSKEVEDIIKSNHYVQNIADLASHGGKNISDRNDPDQNTDQAKWIYDAAIRYLDGPDLTIKRIPPGDVCSQLYLQITTTKTRDTIDVRAISENLRDFKVSIIYTCPFEQWRAYADEDFIIATARRRIWGMFLVDDVIPVDLKDAGFVSITSKDQIETLFQVILTAVDRCQKLEEKLQKKETSMEAQLQINKSVFPEKISGIWYTHFLQQFTKKVGVRNYFEIGVNAGESMHHVSCENAIGVDPSFILEHNVCIGKKRIFLYQQPSDDFYAQNDLLSIFGGKVDVAFLDGMHLFEFLLRDFRNLERSCHPQSVIFLHDCLPSNYDMTVRDQFAPRNDAPPYNFMWTGDVWKLVPILQKYRPDLRIRLLDCAPTGLIAITNLNSTSRVLFESYSEIVAENTSTDNDIERIADMYRSNVLVSAQEVIDSSFPASFLLS